MKVTVLMPVYNAGVYLRDSIESILNQSFEDFEFLIINDGSSDESEAVIKSYNDPRIRTLNNEKNLGLIATLNKGLSLAKGQFIVRQDADDISMPHRLELQVDIMNKNPDLLLLSSNAIIINNNSEFIGESNLPEEEIALRFRMMFKCGIFHTSTIFRKKSLEDYNLKYDPLYPHTEDYKLWSELSRHGKLYVMRDKLVKYRAHQESISSLNKSKQEEIAAKVVRENIKEIGVEVSLQEAKRLRGLFRSTGMNRKYLQNDIKLLLKIINKFEQKYKGHKNYDSSEILDFLKRMIGWVSKSDLLNFKFLILFIYMRVFIFLLLWVKSPFK
ncbi:MAG: glycosyltransferase [Bacteroidota bacterium]|nr:glycosyltransferase [Bacteroidota bacterium]